MSKIEQMLTTAMLCKVIDYDAETGIFTWRNSSGGHALQGKQAGAQTPSGYIRIAIAKKRYYAQQLAWLHAKGEWPKGTIDHINGDKADNRMSNLREAWHDENCQNQRKAHSHNKAGILGVSLRADGKYSAEIMVDGKRRYLGRYATAKDAESAYLKAKQELHPFGTLSNPENDSIRLVKSNKTGLLGVEKKKSGKFASRLNLDGERVNLGLFDTAEAAHEAYMKAKTDHLNRKTGVKSP